MRYLLDSLIGQCFNPRTRDGCEAECPISVSLKVCFNPRTRDGCETTWHQCSSTWRCFNPRTRDGCEVSWQALISYIGAFQSTHP